MGGPLVIELHRAPIGFARPAIAPRPVRSDGRQHLMFAAASLGVQVLLFGVLFTGPVHMPADEWLAGVERPATGFAIEPLTLVLLDERVDTEALWPEPAALAALSLPGRVLVALPKMDLVLSDFGDVEAQTTTARSSEPVDEAGDDRAALFARYVEQIKARVHRAWEQQGSGDRCVARVMQSSHGIVLEVQLLSCGADEHWQQSLIAAIRRASPLPAPPVSQLFVPELSIDFGT